MQIRVCIDSYIQNEIGNYDSRAAYSRLFKNKTHDVGALYIFYIDTTSVYHKVCLVFLCVRSNKLH